MQIFGVTNKEHYGMLSYFAARILNYSDSLNWTQLARRRELHTVNMVYKYTHGLAPEYLQDRFVSNYFLRDSSNKFYVPLTPHQLS